jgi:HAD superfamily hydrolase (TIGR01484 family)
VSDRVLICTDLDRTLLPNGKQSESPGARQCFARLAAREEVSLAYVSGRHLALIEKAITNYVLPQPDYVVADVGTSLYEYADDCWRRRCDWDEQFAPDWGNMDHASIRLLFSDIIDLQLQEATKQSRYKLSFYVPLYTDRHMLLPAMQQRLEKHKVNASLIWSIDEPAGIALLDVVPAGATKYHAVEYLVNSEGFTLESAVFAGDSGNDLPVLTSSIRAVLVANATGEVREEAWQQARARGTADSLYLARGGFMGMNGNYSAGILEGVVHFLPRTRAWLEENARNE